MKERRLNFICVGAQKSGTTTLHEVLQQHPDVFLPEIKETKFFLSDELYERGISFYYENYFSDCGDLQIQGEIDPDLLNSEVVPQRLYENFGGELKIIVLLRDPVDRAFSHYQMSLSRGLERLSFFDALDAEKIRLKDDKSESFLFGNRANFSYVSRGLYYRQISQYYRFFKKDNIKVFFFEDLVADKNSFYSQIFQFIGVDYNANNICLNVKSNVATRSKAPIVSRMFYSENVVRTMVGKVLPKKVKQSLSKVIKELLKTKAVNKLSQKEKAYVYARFFKEDIECLEEMLGRDLGFWKR